MLWKQFFNMILSSVDVQMGKAKLRDSTDANFSEPQFL